MIASLFWRAVRLSLLGAALMVSPLYPGESPSELISQMAESFNEVVQSPDALTKWHSEVAASLKAPISDEELLAVSGALLRFKIAPTPPAEVHQVATETLQVMAARFENATILQAAARLMGRRSRTVGGSTVTSVGRPSGRGRVRALERKPPTGRTAGAAMWEQAVCGNCGQLVLVNL